MKKQIFLLTVLLLLLSTKYLIGQSSSKAMTCTIEFGPCVEFIGANYITATMARKLVPEDYQLEVSDKGTVTSQVRAINCESILITYEDGTKVEGGMHILYQLGVSVLPPVKLDAHPRLKDVEKVTEYHAYAYNTLTNFKPLAEALQQAGINGVHYVDALTLNTGDNDPNACDPVPVYGAIGAPNHLKLSFSGEVRDLGTQKADACRFGPKDITVAERAVWYTDGKFGKAMSDTAVPNSQILLYNADPQTYIPFPVVFTPEGDRVKSIANLDHTQFSFTMSGLLERGQVFTILRPIHEK
ncbi:MAG: hypothetical protein AAF551_15650, partial [Bacteroidota bacterium]